ncbi:MAG: hypothetical protein CMQ38_06140 [Gammaproteobacteria bacterium]|nr:hypothetical protein [Gammaproteobacteria bacterium]
MRCFFNDNIDREDLCVDSEDNPVIEITCYFEEVPEEIVIDSREITSTADEGLLNSNNQLEIKKQITFSGRKSTATYLVANQPSDPSLENLLSLNQTALKQLAETLNIDLDGVDKRKNPQIRKRIRDEVGAGRSEQEVKIEGGLGTGDNRREVYKTIKGLLPIYCLFKNDKTFDDKDGDIKDPMQAAIEEALALEDIQELLNQIEERVRVYSTDVAERTIQKLKYFDEEISENLKSEFSKAPKYDKVFDLTLLNEKNIPLNKRGSGIRRLVVLSFFQAQAERRKFDSNAPSIIYAIEEPETSQHPNHQKMIINSLENLSNEDGVQVIFTTHSANFVRELPLDSLRYISIDADSNLTIESGRENEEPNPDVIDKITKTLGILPNPADSVRVLLYVEGVHDIHALENYSSILHSENQELINLAASEKVAYVITGGSSLKHYIENRYLAGLGKPEVHIYDNDVPDYRTAIEKINNENNPNKIGFNTTKLELESYLHPAAIEEAYASTGLEGMNIGNINDDTDVPLEVAKLSIQLSNNNWDELTGEKQKELSSNKKKFLNTLAVECMTIDRINERGAYDELLLWLNSIQQFT